MSTEATTPVSASASSDNSICIYGESRTGKTREIGTLARKLFQQTGKKTRLVYCDGGGWASIQTEIDLGIIIPLRLSGHPDIWQWITAISKGFWPEDNTITGRLIKFSDHPESDSIGAYAIEGIAAICTELLGWASRNGLSMTGESNPISKWQPSKEENSDPNLVTVVGQVTQGHYGNVGNKLFDLIRNFQRLQAYDIRIIWTSLEAGGEEKIAGMKRSVIGIGSIGKSLTPLLPARFGDLIHIERVVDPKNQTKVEYRAYFLPHEDRELPGRTWPASLRMSPQVNHRFTQDPQLRNGYILLTDEGGKLDRDGISLIWKKKEEYEDIVRKEMLELMKPSKSGK